MGGWGLRMHKSRELDAGERTVSVLTACIICKHLDPWHNAFANLNICKELQRDCLLLIQGKAAGFGGFSSCCEGICFKRRYTVLTAAMCCCTTTAVDIARRHF